MTEIDRIIALERELEATRQAAVDMVVALAHGALRTAEGREELALAIESIGGNERYTEAAKLARMVAEAMRRG